MNIKFSILITTKNRLIDLKITLQNITGLTERADVEVLIYDDGSNDGTFEFLNQNYPNFQLHRNEKSKGLIHNRNMLLNSCNGKYAISLDDDAHFLSENVLENIEKYFQIHSKCGVIACRVFWGKKPPQNNYTLERPSQVKSFVGCGHVWNIQAWREIPNYPEWFVFYGEEDFASYQLFKNGWEVHYVPEILVHHRVDVKSRRKDTDYRLRTRRSLRSGWYLYFLFYPIRMIPRRMVYSIWAQFKLKTIKGDWKASLGLIQALGDLFLNFPRLVKQSNRLNYKEFQRFSRISPPKVYWSPEDDK